MGHIPNQILDDILTGIDRTDEMAPQWFSEREIPYQEMWQTDEYWLPFVLADEYFVGRSDFKRLSNEEATDGDTVPWRWWFGSVEKGVGEGVKE